jgi:hypothetical protein
MHRSGSPRAARLAVGLATFVVLAFGTSPLHAQAEAYPERPRPRPEAEEIALAMSAAPWADSAPAAK